MKKTVRELLEEYAPASWVDLCLPWTRIYDLNARVRVSFDEALLNMHVSQYKWKPDAGPNNVGLLEIRFIRCLHNI